MLSNLIKKTKSDYYNAKFSSVSGDKKKIGKLLTRYVGNVSNHCHHLLR